MIVKSQLQARASCKQEENSTVWRHYELHLYSCLLRNRQVGAYSLSDKQVTVCEEWESVEVRTRMKRSYHLLCTEAFCRALLLDSNYISKIIDIVCLTLTAAGIPGIVTSACHWFSFGHRHRKGSWNKLATTTWGGSPPSETRLAISLSYLDRLEIGCSYLDRLEIGCTVLRPAVTLEQLVLGPRARPLEPAVLLFELMILSRLGF